MVSTLAKAELRILLHSSLWHHLRVHTLLQSPWMTRPPNRVLGCAIEHDAPRSFMDLLTRLTALASLTGLLASCGDDGAGGPQPAGGSPQPTVCNPLSFGAV